MSDATSTVLMPSTRLPEPVEAKVDYETPLAQRTDITVDELERLSLPATAELYDGRVVFKMANPLHAALQLAIGSELYLYLKHHPVGVAFTDAHFRLWPERNDRARVPDISFVVKSRLPDDMFHYPSMAPDLAVEILSPTDNFFDVMDKVDEYLEQGTKIVWLVIPHKEEVLVCTAEGKHSVRDVLAAQELLPGFQISIKQVFAEVKAAASK